MPKRQVLLAVLVLAGGLGYADYVGTKTPAGRTAARDFDKSFLRRGTGYSEGFVQYLDYARGGSEITVGRHEQPLSSGNNDWESIETDHSVAYEIADIASRDGGDTLYIAGLIANDQGDLESVVERWSFQPPKGGHFIESKNGAPTGSKSGEYEWSTGIRGEFQAIRDRTEKRAEPRRERIYRGQRLGQIDLLILDPQGRYLITLSRGLGEMHSLDILGEQPIEPQLVPGASDLPHLTVANSARIWQLPAHGRFIYLTEFEGHGIPLGRQHTIVVDAENDGIFESSVTMDQSAWNASPYSKCDDWQDFRIHGGMLDR